MKASKPKDASVVKERRSDGAAGLARDEEEELGEDEFKDGAGPTKTKKRGQAKAKLEEYKETRSFVKALAESTLGALLHRSLSGGKMKISVNSNYGFFIRA